MEGGWVLREWCPVKDRPASQHAGKAWVSEESTLEHTARVGGGACVCCANVVRGSRQRIAVGDPAPDGERVEGIDESCCVLLVYQVARCSVSVHGAWPHSVEAGGLPRCPDDHLRGAPGAVGASPRAVPSGTAGTSGNSSGNRLWHATTVYVYCVFVFWPPSSLPCTWAAVYRGIATYLWGLRRHPTRPGVVVQRSSRGSGSDRPAIMLRRWKRSRTWLMMSG